MRLLTVSAVAFVAAVLVASSVHAVDLRPGDLVVTRNINPAGHTRLPRYARGRRGVVDRHHGVFIFADAHAAGKGKSPQNLYSVKFSARELWGAQGSETDCIFIDLWDDHLDPV